MCPIPGSGRSRIVRLPGPLRSVMICHVLSCSVMVPMRMPLARPSVRACSRRSGQGFRVFRPASRASRLRYGSVSPSNPSSFRSSRRLAQAAGPCFARIARARPPACAGAVRAPDCAYARVNRASAGHTSPVSFSGVFSRRRRRERRSGSRDVASLPPAPISHGLPEGQSFTGIISPFYEQTMKFNLAFPQPPARIISAAFSPIMMEGALVLPEVSVGMIEASATRRPSMPWTRSRSSTTAIGSEPILQVPMGW